VEKDTKRIITHEWFQIIALGLTVVGLFMWNHSEIHALQKESQEIRMQGINEMKDFHGRLCALEEKYQQMMERYLEDRRNN